MSALPVAHERRTTTPSLVFDLVDAFAARRGTRGPNPRPTGEVRFRIAATEQAGVRTALRRPHTMVMQRNTAGYDLWFGSVVDDGGTRKFPAPPSPVISIVADGHQPAELVAATIPDPSPQRIDLEPGWTYPFPLATRIPGASGPTLLRGTLHAPDGSGISGARVQVVPAPPNQPAPNPVYTTDGTGNWVLPFDDGVAPTATADVEIRFPSAPAVVVGEVGIVRGDTSVLRQASLSGETHRGDGDPLPGVAVTVDVAPGTATSDADGRWQLWLPVERFPPSHGPQPAVVTATPSQGAPIVRNTQIEPRSTTRLDPLVFP